MRRWFKYGLLALAVALLLAATFRTTDIYKFQNGIATSSITPFIHSGETSDLTMVIGGATMESLTVTTDGTGTGEVVLPLQSVAGAEIVNSAVISIQNGAAPAATCTVGEIFIDTDQTVDTNCTTTADNSLCLCTATDTWTALENN